MSDEKEYIPAIPENLEFPLQEISKILNQIDNLCTDVIAIEKYLAGKHNLSRKMIRQCAIKYGFDGITENSLEREQKLARDQAGNPVITIAPPKELYNE
jgi:hypothetical protein